jgi:hypothetical protein
VQQAQARAGELVVALAAAGCLPAIEVAEHGAHRRVALEGDDLRRRALAGAPGKAARARSSIH